MAGGTCGGSCSASLARLREAVRILWQLEHTSWHLLISASKSCRLLYSGRPILNFFSPRKWSNSMASTGNLLPQSVHGLLFSSLTHCLIVFLRLRFDAAARTFCSSRFFSYHWRLYALLHLEQRPLVVGGYSPQTAHALGTEIYSGMGVTVATPVGDWACPVLVTPDPLILQEL